MFSSSDRARAQRGPNPRGASVKRALSGLLAFLLATLSLGVIAAPAAHAATSLPPETVTVSATVNPIVADGQALGKLVITVEDQLGNPVTDAVITAHSSGDIFLFSSTTNRNDGSYTKSYRASKTADTETITVSVTNPANNNLGNDPKTATTTITEVPGPVATLTVSLNPSHIKADGVSTSTATISAKDAFGNLVPGQQIGVGMGSGNDAVPGPVTDNGDGTYTSVIKSSTTPGNETVIATGANKTGTATLTEFGAPTDGVLALNPTSVVANGTSTSLATATITDAGGRGVSGLTVTIAPTALTASSSTVGPVTDRGDGTYVATVTSSTKAGEESFLASTTPADPNLEATAILTKTSGAASAVTLTLDKATIIADGAATSIATAVVKDVNGNTVSDEVVTFTTSGDVTFGTVTNEGAGVYKSVITASTTTGTETITAKATKANKTGTAVLTETLGPASAVTLVLSPASIAADGGTSKSNATATVKDAQGRVIKDENVTITTDGGATISAVTPQGDGTYTAVISSGTVPGAQTITATATKASKTGTATLTQFGPTATLTVLATPDLIHADGTSKGTVKATLKDAGDRPVTNATVLFGVSHDIKLGTVTNNLDGTYTAPYTASTTPEVETVTATGGGKSGTDTITEYGNATSVTVATIDPVVADGASTVTAIATVKDLGNRPVADEIVTFTSSGDATFGSVTNNGDGTYTVTITSSTTADTETITAKATKANKTGTGTLTETAGPATTVVLELDPTTVPADGTTLSAATVTVTDQFGNLVTDETVVLSSSGDTVPANAGATTNNGDGTYTGAIKASTTSGIETITATALGTGAFQDQQLRETPGDPASITLSLSPSTITANGTSTSTATAFVRDANGNLVPGATVTIDTDGDSSPAAVIDKHNGSYSSVITASNTADTETITATVDGVATPDTATLTEVAGTAPSVTVVLAPSTIAADGTSTTTATATVVAANGNVVKNDTVRFERDGVVVVPSATNNNDGTYTGVITATSQAGARLITAVATTTAQSGSTTLTQTAGPGVVFSLALSPSTLTANGTSTSTATATLADASGNPIVDDVVSFVTDGDVGVGTTTNNGDGTYTATLTASTSAGKETITAEAADAGEVASATLTENPGSPSSVTLALSPTSIVANGTATSTGTATVKDANGNPISGLALAFTTNGDAAPGPTSQKANGVYTSVITASKTADTETITATLTGTALKATSTLTEKAGPAVTVALALSPVSVPADGESSSIATATVRDAFDNLVKDEVVTMATDGDVAVGPVTNKGDGTYTAQLVASDTDGLETITATATKANKTGAATLTEKFSLTGYWLTAADGGIFAFGDAPFFGSIGGAPLNEPVVGMAATTDRGGYWEVATDGGIFAFGNAPFRGSMGGTPLNQPVAGLAPTSTGNGYWMVAEDGGIFAFGDALFKGSMGGVPLNAPVVDMVPTSTGNGYWMVASDGGVFAFGDAAFVGSLGGAPLNSPIVGLAPTSTGNGYWMVAEDGGIFAFGDAVFFGSAIDDAVGPIVGMAPIASGQGYRLVDALGLVYEYGDATWEGEVEGDLVSPITGIAGF
jgi:adhesin/invasin